MTACTSQKGKGLAWVVRVVLQKAIPGVFVLLMTRRKSFLKTQMHFGAVQTH